MSTTVPARNDWAMEVYGGGYFMSGYCTGQVQHVFVYLPRFQRLDLGDTEQFGRWDFGVCLAW